MKDFEIIPDLPKTTPVDYVDEKWALEQF